MCRIKLFYMRCTAQVDPPNKYYKAVSETASCPYTVHAHGIHLTRSTACVWLRKIARAARALRQHSWMRWKAHCIANDEKTGIVKLSFRLKGS